MTTDDRGEVPTGSFAADKDELQRAVEEKVAQARAAAGNEPIVNVFPTCRGPLMMSGLRSFDAFHSSRKASIFLRRYMVSPHAIKSGDFISLYNFMGHFSM